MLDSQIIQPLSLMLTSDGHMNLFTVLIVMGCVCLRLASKKYPPISRLEVITWITIISAMVIPADAIVTQASVLSPKGLPQTYEYNLFSVYFYTLYSVLTDFNIFLSGVSYSEVIAFMFSKTESLNVVALNPSDFHFKLKVVDFTLGIIYTVVPIIFFVCIIFRDYKSSVELLFLYFMSASVAAVANSSLSSMVAVLYGDFVWGIYMSLWAILAIILCGIFSMAIREIVERSAAKSVKKEFVVQLEK